MRNAMTTLCQGTAWSAWIPLEHSWRGTRSPSCPGLYRILLVDGERTQMAYIGQSRNVKERLGALKHVYGEMAPQHTPHFAGPALWQWRVHLPQAHFEVSVAPFPTIPKPLRLGLECLAIALCQQEQGASPLANFGRTRDEWEGLWRADEAQRAQEVSPTGLLQGDPHSSDWCGLDWTAWTGLTGVRLPDVGHGLYRLRVAGCDPLLCIGQGEIAARLRGYHSSLPLEGSWVAAPWSYHRRLELKSTAIGAHLLTLAAVPLWQFEQNVPPNDPADLSAAA